MKLIQWDITSACNLKCKHCRLGNTSRLYELPTEYGKKLLLQSKNAKVEFFNFSGGEPFLRKDIFELIETASTLFKEITITTNGTLLNREIVKKLSNYRNIRLSVSLDANKKDHDRFRGVIGAFDMTIKGLKILVENKVRFSIKCTLTKYTTNPFKPLKLAKKLGAEFFSLRSVIPVGRADKEMLLDTKEYITLIRKVLDMGRKMKVKVVSDDPILIPVFPELVEETHETLKNKWMGCLMGSEILYISSNGDVFPCAYVPLKIGNVRNDPLKNIVRFKLPKKLKNYRKYLSGKCRSCKYLYVCGGCRAVALAINGDIFSDDPRCLVRKRWEIMLEGG
jgi:radical SAM protein with 4Fe4S-binding SPASM domain